MERSNIIFIRDLRLEMNIGIFEQEKRGSQPVLVNAEIALDPALTWRKDDIAETVAYDELVALVEKISAKKHYELIETFLETAAEEILKVGKVRGVKLSAQKPGILKNTGAVGVEITRTK
jgi:dihydroneopterin aldolase